MTPEEKAEFLKLDEERREIEDRIHIRAAIHHGKKEYPGCDGKMHPLDDTAMAKIGRTSPAADGERYVQIMDREWGLWTGNYSHGSAESHPD